MRRKFILTLLIMVIGALVLVAAGCGGGSSKSSGGGDTSAGNGGGAGDTSAIQALPSSSCSGIEYKGSGPADVLLASDFPLQGSSRTQTTQINAAIRYLLEQSDWKAGDQNVAFQACDDATAQAGKWDSGKCSQNANAYAQNEKLIAVIGTFNSGCAAIEIPVLNQAPGGGLALVSPANTYGCLTEPCAGDEPEKYYPTETRNYARVAPSDPNQGAVDAEFLSSMGVKSVYILNDKEAYGLGVAKNFKGAAESLGIKTLGFAAYDPKQANFQATFTKIKSTNPDAVFIGGLVDENSGQLIDDKVSVLGPNDGDVKLMLPDGFTTDAIFDPAEGGTKNARGAFFSVAGAPIDQYKGKGKEFADALAAQLNGKAIDPYAILGAQAAEVVLNAIAASDGSRGSVIEQIFQTKIEDGYIGSFEINENGDVTGASGAVLTFTLYKGADKLETIKTLEPKPETVDAARAAAAG